VTQGVGPEFKPWYYKKKKQKKKRASHGTLYFMPVGNLNVIAIGSCSLFDNFFTISYSVWRFETNFQFSNNSMNR
jgi:hypothetical protein